MVGDLPRAQRYAREGPICVSCTDWSLRASILHFEHELAEWWLGTLALAVIAVAMFTGTIAGRNGQGGMASFREAWLFSMSVARLGHPCFCTTDPELPVLMTELTLEKTRSMMEGFGVSGDLLDMQMKDIRSSIEGAYTAGGLATNSASGMVMWAVVSLIVAAICKRAPQSEFS